MSIQRRLLLADDDSEVRLGVAELLQTLDLEVLHAESGPEALEIASRVSLSAALLDVHMPGFTGLECLPRLRRTCVDLPCLLYSGRWTPGLEQAAMDAGALALLRKPVQPDVLRREVRVALGIEDESSRS
jgi:CheY-like chemotaxis protein